MKYLMKTLYEHLDNWIKTNDYSNYRYSSEDEIKEEFTDFFKAFFTESDIIDWPKDEDEDDIDLENFEVISYTDNILKILAGGDWQESYEIDIRFDNGVFYVINSKICEEYYSGLDDEELYELLIKNL